MKQKIISGLLVFSLILSVIPGKVNAAFVPAIVGGALTGTVSGVSAYVGAMGTLGSLFLGAAELLPDLTEVQREKVLNAAATLGYPGDLGSHTALERRCNSINQLYSNPNLLDKFLDDTTLITLEQASQITAFIQTAGLYPFKVTEIEVGSGDSKEFRWVITDERERYIVADSLGRYPYSVFTKDHFVPEDSIRNEVQLLGDADLSRKYTYLQKNDDYHPFKYMEYTHFGERYKVIGYYGDDGVLNLYSTEDGYFFGARLDKNGYAGEQPRDPVEVETPSGEDVPIPDGTEMEIDVDSDLYFMPDGTLALIEQLLYDPTNKSYTITANNSFNTTNNTYYEFKTTNIYFVEYTSVTYIGSTGEYTEEYKYYYQLPDGRSSADLTAEELEALNMYVDVLPYIRSADDTSIRALYHFDGDTLDKSYWSHIGNFKWEEGASITYMEANAFNGALYLDETSHKFHIQLPSNIGSKDFTMQFRYYQSYTAAPQLDSYVAFENTKLVQFNGSSLLNGSGTALNAISVGNWQEICLQRIDGTLIVFLNGVRIGTSSLSGAFGDTITFVFGTSQQTYKYFDEFRFVNEAVYPSTGYTPSSVPFDTNLALVLPDSSIPVADEYWTFESSKENLLTQYGLDNWLGGAALNSAYLRSGSIGSYSRSVSSPYWYYHSNVTSPEVLDGVHFTTSSGASLPSNTTSTGSVDNYIYENFIVSSQAEMVPTGGFFTLLSGVTSGTACGSYRSGTYTFSLVDSGGVVHSFTFTVPSVSAIRPGASSVLSSANLGSYEVKLLSCGRGALNALGNYIYLQITAPFGELTDEFIYWELVEGSGTDLAAVWNSDVVVMQKPNLNTPSLAVRTDIDITGYQIGGVRPSLPEKGQVWALVESSRITSLQIYNGQAWVEVDGRIWTGSRWVPYYAYDVLLLKDMYDVVGTNPDKDYIYTETGFWTWLQGAWSQMMAKLEQIRVAVSGGGGADGGTPVVPDDLPADEDDGWSFVDLVVNLADGTWTIVRRTVKLVFNGVADISGSVDHIGSLFDSLDPDSSTGIFFIPLE